MTVRVVRVGHVRMCVPQRVVPMPVAVFAQGHRVMPVCVVSLVVAVGVLVLQRLVRVLVAV